MAFPLLHKPSNGMLLAPRTDAVEARSGLYRCAELPYSRAKSPIGARPTIGSRGEQNLNATTAAHCTHPYCADSPRPTDLTVKKRYEVGNKDVSQSWLQSLLKEVLVFSKKCCFGKAFLGQKCINADGISCLSILLHFKPLFSKQTPVSS